MKACKFYIGKEFLAEKLGIKESQFAIGEVKSNHSEIEFTILIDQDATTNVENEVENLKHDNWNIRRNKL